MKPETIPAMECPPPVQGRDVSTADVSNGRENEINLFQRLPRSVLMRQDAELKTGVRGHLAVMAPSTCHQCSLFSRVLSLTGLCVLCVVIWT